MSSLIRIIYLAALCATSGQVQAAFVSFNYTGGAQSFLVPIGVSSIKIDSWGAQGWSATNTINLGGFGGYASGVLSVTAGESLTVYVGGAGTVANIAYTPMGGGFNGGGNGQTNYSNIYTNYAGGGGGASDVRQGGSSLLDRVIVAAGGGGATGNTGAFGGDGGALIGLNGGDTVVYPGGTGGTQSAGGLNAGFGFGGSATSGETPWNGGGGGGWYGGGVSAAHAGGGGGSSYLGGVAFGSTISGVRSGNGYIVFTYTVDSVPEPATMAMWGVGAIGLVFVRRKRLQIKLAT